MNEINKVAILIDGGFFIQRFKKLNSRAPYRKDVEKLIADVMEKLSKSSDKLSDDIVFRTYYYDCLPFGKTLKDPDGVKIDYSKTPIYRKQSKFINSLTNINQLALRLGELSFSGWKINGLKPDSKPYPDFRQKGVDMKIGLDMAWMASRDTINKIVLVAGDTDFISPMKLVRREGILIYIYSMGHKLTPKLIEHSDFVLD